jgi:predicted Na+-dependent transporter
VVTPRWRRQLANRHEAHQYARGFTVATVLGAALAVTAFFVKNPDAAVTPGVLTVLFLVSAAFAWRRYYSWKDGPRSGPDSED